MKARTTAPATVGASIRRWRKLSYIVFVAKASLFGATITFPITNGRFNLGTWQGIYLCEFRAAKHSRRVVATILP